MSIKIADHPDDDSGRWSRVLEVALGTTWTTDDHALWLEYLRDQQRLAAYDGTALIGTAGGYATELTVPGGMALGCSAVTGVGTLPTHRRKGVQTALMREQVERARAAGHELMALEASESAIYGRYGYGPATRHVTAVIDTAHAQLDPVFDDDGTFEFAEEEAIVHYGQPIWNDARRLEPGHLQRPRNWWAIRLYDVPSWRSEGGGELQAVFHVDSTGTPDGFALYRIAAGLDGSLHASQMTIIEVVSAKPKVEGLLYQWLLGMDLVAFAKIEGLRHDDPLRHRLVDHRRLRTMDDRDALWLKIVNVPMALSQRHFMHDVTCTFTVHDDFDDQVAGTYELQVADGAGICRPSDATTADVELDTATLGSVFLGGNSLRTMIDAGRATTTDKAKALELDLALRSPVPPRHRGEF